MGVGVRHRFCCDTDHNGHGIATAIAGLMAPNHCLAVAIDSCLRTARSGDCTLQFGKTVVSTQLIDRLTAILA
jgi:phosphoglucomutase